MGDYLQLKHKLETGPELGPLIRPPTVERPALTPYCAPPSPVDDLLAGIPWPGLQAH